VGKFGPQVQRVSVTAVADTPEAIVVGLNRQFVNAGNPEHAKLTSELNVPPPAGAAEKV
jgi:hypothetical protein